MILHSTNGISPKVSFAEGISNGLAPDGGLYMPDTFPRLPQAFFRNIAEMSLREIAYVISNTLFGDVLGSATVKKIVDDTLNFDIPLRGLDSGIYVAELFHGPTLSFKDIGARFMANLLPALDKDGDSGRDILLATSGDSGGAIANAFQKASDTNVYVLFPKDELTREQTNQFATLRNVTAIEVDGSFDDCQTLVKEALRTHTPAKRRRMTAGNSINAARELPSIICFFHAYARVLEETEERDAVVMSVPCGNLGSLCAALMAKKMGLPVKRFIAANNSNDVFVEYLKTGGFRPQKTLLTLARAMDVGNPSNIARIMDLYGGNLASLRNDVEGYAYNDSEIAETMRDISMRFDYLIDPQGATALRALSRHIHPGEIGVAMATAHPAKFRSTVKAVTGREPACPKALENISHHPVKVIKIPPTLGALNRAMGMRRT